MKIKRLIALLSAAVLMFTMTGCDLADLFLDSDELNQIPSDHAELRYDTDEAKEIAASIQSVWNVSGNDDKITDVIQNLLHAVEDAAEIYFRAEMQYYRNWNDQDLTLLYQQTMEDFYVVRDTAAWIMANGAGKSVYRDLFRPYADQKNMDYYMMQSLNKVTSAARSSSASSGRFLDAYYSTAYDPDQDADTANAACAKLYLESLSSYQTDNYLYDYYLRDYTVEDTLRVYDELVEKMLPVFRSLDEEIRNDVERIREDKKRFHLEHPLEVIRQYAGRISPDIEHSINRLLDDELYVTAEGDECYDGCYTVPLPQKEGAMIYLFCSGTYSDFAAALHEFGHFHANCHDLTPTLIRKNCTDIAEIQSQGFEMLFTEFYPEIFGEYASFLEKYALYCIMDSVIAGFAVGKFEYEVMKEQKNMTPEQVLECFREIHDECDLAVDMYQITHLFEQPGYYISYGVSALAALQIYTLMQQSFPDAVSKYEKIAKTPSSTSECRFCGTLSECGFDEIFSESYIDKTIGQITDRIQLLNQKQ